MGEIYERMTVDPGRLFTATIGRLTLAYQLNARCFVRVIAQQVDHDYNVALYHDDRGPKLERLSGHLLLFYELNPRTVLFLGATTASATRTTAQP